MIQDLVSEFTQERELLDRVASGNSNALATVFERYGTLVYNVAHRFTWSADDAEDVLQDVFVGLPEALRKFEGRGSFEGWLKRVTVRVALTRLRNQKRLREVPIDDQTPIRSEVTQRSAEQMTIEDAVQALPPSLRVVFVLTVVEGYSHAEVAELLNIREGASKVRLYRARKRLQQNLERST